MSYQGGVSYMPVETVDEVADYTDMQGQASMMNHRGQGPSWKNDPTRSLVWLWVVVVITYWLTGFFFRRYLV